MTGTGRCWRSHFPISSRRSVRPHPELQERLTAPAGSAGSNLIQLERDDKDIIWLSLDPACTAVVDIEVLDETGLGIR